MHADDVAHQRDLGRELGTTYQMRGGNVQPFNRGFLTWDFPLMSLDLWHSLTGPFLKAEADGEMVQVGECVVSEKLTFTMELSLDGLIGEGLSWIATKGNDGREAMPEFVGPSMFLEDCVGAGGPFAVAGIAGARTAAVAAGKGTCAASAGYNSVSAVKGEESSAASAGKCARSVAAGPDCMVAVSGVAGKAASVGANAKAAVVGDMGEVESEGEGSVAAAIGRTGMGKVGEGGLLVLIHYSKGGEPLRAVSARAGQGGTLKPGTWYRLDANGAFEEARLYPMRISSRRGDKAASFRQSAFRLSDPLAISPVRNRYRLSQNERASCWLSAFIAARYYFPRRWIGQHRQARVGIEDRPSDPAELQIPAMAGSAHGREPRLVLECGVVPTIWGNRTPFIGCKGILERDVFGREAFNRHGFIGANAGQREDDGCRNRRSLQHRSSCLKIWRSLEHAAKQMNRLKEL